MLVPREKREAAAGRRILPALGHCSACFLADVCSMYVCVCVRSYFRYLWSNERGGRPAVHERRHCSRTTTRLLRGRSPPTRRREREDPLLFSAGGPFQEIETEGHFATPFESAAKERIECPIKLSGKDRLRKFVVDRCFSGEVPGERPGRRRLSLLRGVHLLLPSYESTEHKTHSISGGATHTQKGALSPGDAPPRPTRGTKVTPLPPSDKDKHVRRKRDLCREGDVFLSRAKRKFLAHMAEKGKA